MRLTDEENVRAFNDPRRKEAQAALDKALETIRNCVTGEWKSADYYLIQLPIYLSRLQDAYNRFNQTEAMVKAEILAQRKGGVGA